MTVNQSEHFSLDIEGAELGVLRSVPWDKLDIWVVSVETHLAGLVFPGSRQDIIDYMDTAGYIMVSWSDNDLEKDDLFVRSDIMKKAEKSINAAKDEL